MGIALFPSITINGEVFAGNYRDTNAIFKTICAKLETRPEECKRIGLAYEKEKIL